MSDEQPKPPVPVTVTAIVGSSASDDGQFVKIGLRTASGETADLFMSPDRVVDLIALAAGAAGRAAQNKSGDVTIRYILPATTWEVEPMLDTGQLRLAFQLPGGPEMCFQIEHAQAVHMHESLGVILGIASPPPVPTGQWH